MATATQLRLVLTFAEAAEYLRISEQKLKTLTDRGGVPSREIEGEWRFSRAALDEWLKGPTPKEISRSQAGVLAHDKEYLDKLRKEIYADRGRPEAEGDE